jgi:hypothetical protein
MNSNYAHTLYKLLGNNLSLQTNNIQQWPLSTEVWCWHCCHPFKSVPLSIPQRKLQTLSVDSPNVVGPNGPNGPKAKAAEPQDKKNIFYNTQNHQAARYEVYGVFCSLNCAISFIMQHACYNQQQQLLLLREMATVVFGISREKALHAKPAPAKAFLRVFGGHLGIEAFRGLSITCECLTQTPPFVSMPMVLQTHTNDMQHSITNLRRPTNTLPTQNTCDQKQTGVCSELKPGGLYQPFLDSKEDVEGKEQFEKNRAEYKQHVLNSKASRSRKKNSTPSTGTASLNATTVSNDTATVSQQASYNYNYNYNYNCKQTTGTNIEPKLAGQHNNCNDSTQFNTLSMDTTTGTATATATATTATTTSAGTTTTSQPSAPTELNTVDYFRNKSVRRPRQARSRKTTGASTATSNTELSGNIGVQLVQTKLSDFF